MKKEELKKTVLEFAQSEHCQDAYERLAEAFFGSIASDDEPYHKIGYSLMKAFLDDDVDAAVTALCGWSFQTLLVKAGLLSDTEGVFGDVPAPEKLTPFEKDHLAQTIAHDIVIEGTSNTTSGNWLVYFEEINEKYEVNLSEDEALRDAIENELRNSYEEKIAELCVTDEAFDIVYYLDFCSNAE